MNIRPISRSDYPEVARIYAEGLDTGIASFETEVPDWDNWNEKFLEKCRFIAESDGKVAGWCAISQVSKREVYRGVAEVTIYIAQNMRGQGIGRKLLNHLVQESENEGFWTLQAGIFPENQASISLHKRCGFKVIGIRERPAERLGIWYDNVLLERRSTKTALKQ